MPCPKQGHNTYRYVIEGLADKEKQCSDEENRSQICCQPSVTGSGYCGNQGNKRRHLRKIPVENRRYPV